MNRKTMVVSFENLIKFILLHNVGKRTQFRTGFRNKVNMLSVRPSLKKMNGCILNSQSGL